MSYHAIIKFVVLSQYRKEFAELIQWEAEVMVKEELGTVQVISTIDVDDPNVFVNHEIYKDEKAFQKHLNGKIAKEFIGKADQWLVAGPIFLAKGNFIGNVGNIPKKILGKKEVDRLIKR